MCHLSRRTPRRQAAVFPALIGVGERLSVAADSGSNSRGRKPRCRRSPQSTGKDLESLLTYLTPQSTRLMPTRITTPSIPAPSEGAPDEVPDHGLARFSRPGRLPRDQPPWGTLNAIDLNTGKYLWKVPLGEYPKLAAAGLTNTGTENYGGPIVTAGGVLFIGATVYDKKFRAFDSSHRKAVVGDLSANSAVATPATYMVDGKQYVVVAAGGGKDPKDQVGQRLCGVYPAVKRIWGGRPRPPPLISFLLHPTPSQDFNQIFTGH